jgi:DNA-binding response OmpR family regulator
VIAIKNVRLLIIEDDPEVSRSLKTNLKAEGFTTDTASDGDKGLKMAKIDDYSLIIMDLNLPGKNGDEICREIRDAGKTTPILMLTVNSEVNSKVQLLEYGADDYLTKPFALKELLARVRALLRRPKAIMPRILKIDSLTLDQNRQTVTRAGKKISLTTTEFKILEYLMRNQGQVISRGTIIEDVWGESADMFSNAIETHIANIRRKIGKNKAWELIQTISGRGYKIG